MKHIPNHAGTYFNDPYLQNDESYRERNVLC